MNKTYAILAHLEIANHRAANLAYISKLLFLHNMFNMEEIEAFYTTYKDAATGIKVDDDIAVSVTYCLLNNTDLCLQASDAFFLQILQDYEEESLPSEILEQKLVATLNSVQPKNEKFYKYVDKHKNLLYHTAMSIQYVKHCTSYYMKYAGYDISIIRMLLTRLTIDSKKYIESQGCVNTFMFCVCLIFGVHNPVYINNVDVKYCKTHFCYRHLQEFIQKSDICRRYFIKEGDISTLLNNSTNVRVQDVCKSFINGYGGLSLDMILYLFVANKQNLAAADMDAITEECIESRKLFVARMKDSCNNQIDETDTQASLNLNRQKLRQRQRRKHVYPALSNKDKEYLIENVSALDYSVDRVIEYCDIIFSEYDLTYIYKFILNLIDKHKEQVVEKIQLYIIKTLSSGFFEEVYFDMIHTIYKKVQCYNKNIAIRKNNDKIIMLISKYCVFFDKSLYIGNLKQKP